MVVWNTDNCICYIMVDVMYWNHTSFWLQALFNYYWENVFSPQGHVNLTFDLLI